LKEKQKGLHSGFAISYQPITAVINVRVQRRTRLSHKLRWQSISELFISRFVSFKCQSGLVLVNV